MLTVKYKNNLYKHYTVKHCREILNVFVRAWETSRKGETLANFSVLFRSRCKLTLNRPTMYVYCFYSVMFSSYLMVSSKKSAPMLLPCLTVAQHEPGTRKAISRSVIVYKLSSQCNWTPQIEPVQDKWDYLYSKLPVNVTVLVITKDTIL